MVQKMRRYISAFSKDDEKEKHEFSRSDTNTPTVTSEDSSKFDNSGILSGWNMIRHSTLGCKMEQTRLEEDGEEDIRYV